MIWIASFPRSGNTYIRNILYEVYGLESSTFHKDADYPLDADYEKYPMVKTHLLPSQLIPLDNSIKAVYLVRDGRDAMCSIAHHRKDIVSPGSDYFENLKAAIIAERGSFFGGWSVNAKEWIQRADIIIRYEDLIIDPIKVIERLRCIIDMPDPKPENLPSFQQMKFGIPQYGSGKNRNISEDNMRALSEKNFRKGKAGSWKEEMPIEMQELFWSYHGEMMEKLGYSWQGDIKPLNQDLDYSIINKLGHTVKSGKKYNILIESDKLLSPDNDGVKRYQSGLMRAMWPLTENPNSSWNIDLYLKGKIIALKDCKDIVFSNFNNKDLGSQKTDSPNKKSFFQKIEETIVSSVPDKFIGYLNKKKITVFHRVYNFFRKILFDFIDLKNSVINFVLKNAYQLKEALVELFNRKRYKAFEKYDLIHLPLMQHYKPFRKRNKPIVVSMHDLTHRYFPSYHTSINVCNAEKGLKFIDKKKLDVIAVSKSTFQDTLMETSIPKEKLHLVYEAVENEKFSYRINAKDNRKVLEKYNLSNKLPYLLCLSTLEPRKNLTNTIKAFILLFEKNPDIYINLVIAGKKGWAIDSLFIYKKLLAKRIIFTDFIDDEDLAVLYSEALALCYVSYYEGFGLPPLEAMRCMTPVIYGNNSSMPEIVGEGGIASDPDDINEIMENMKLIITDKNLRDELSKKALRQSLKFSWRKTAIETLKVYEKIIIRNNK